jgi:pre-rRNA-processing protein TSR1
VPLTKAERAEHDEQFPDEMDTPSDVAARVRFARYRALLSFRASPWHPKENLPIDYSRIFQFENFAGTQRRLLAEAKAVEQLQMNQALQSRAAQRSSSNGSCGGSVTSSSIKRKQQQQKKQKSSGKSVAEGAEDDDCSVVSMDEEEDGDEEGEGEGMEVEGEGSLAKQAAAGGGGSSSSSTLTVPGAEDFVRPGQYIRLELEDVPAAVLERLQTMGHLLAYSLYEHEQKLSVLHFSVQKHKSAAESAPIKSKDELMFMVRQLDNILLFIYLI